MEEPEWTLLKMFGPNSIRDSNWKAVGHVDTLPGRSFSFLEMNENVCAHCWTWALFYDHAVVLSCKYWLEIVAFPLIYDEMGCLEPS